MRKNTLSWDTAKWNSTTWTNTCAIHEVTYPRNIIILFAPCSCHRVFSVSDFWSPICALVAWGGFDPFLFYWLKFYYDKMSERSVIVINKSRFSLKQSQTHVTSCSCKLCCIEQKFLLELYSYSNVMLMSRFLLHLWQVCFGNEPI